MNITQVHYQKLVNLGDYENERFGAWANVGEDETPEAALAALQAWVEERAGATSAARDRLGDLESEQRRMENEAQQLEARVRNARERWERVKAFLERVGIPLPAAWTRDEDLPF